MPLEADNLINMNKARCLIIFCLILLVACHSDRKPSLKIGLFDISKNDGNILFSFSKNGTISIASVNLDGKGLKVIVRSTVDSNYYNPTFSPDGSKMLFLGSKRNNEDGCSMFLARSDGTQKREILRDRGEIIEAVFSGCEEKIYYIKSKEFGHSSPLGRSQPHNSDVYSLSLVDGSTQQITHKAAYSMYRLSEFKCDKILLSMSNGIEKGLQMFAKDKPEQITEINPVNNPRKDNSFYNTPFYSQKYNMLAFIAPYELYIMSMNNRIARLVIYDDDMVKYFRFYNNQEKIVYTNEHRLSFYIVDFKGAKVSEIDIGSAFD